METCEIQIANRFLLEQNMNNIWTKTASEFPVMIFLRATLANQVFVVLVFITLQCELPGFLSA